jgi:hypothetical protein
MYRLIYIILVAGLLSCSKDESTPPPPAEIPDILNGDIAAITVEPIDITTPDKAHLLILVQNTLYKVNFDASPQAQSNALITFATDTILSEFSREFANLGEDEVAYNPLNPNDVTISFNDGRKVFGRFTVGTTFGGIFGRDLIAQWRVQNDPSKPNAKAKTDLMNFVKFYADKDGDGPETDPIYLTVSITKQ